MPFVVPVQILAALPDQDSFYDVTDCLEQLGMEALVQKHLSSKRAEPDLKAQFSTYEVPSPRSCDRSASCPPTRRGLLSSRVSRPPGGSAARGRRRG